MKKITKKEEPDLPPLIIRSMVHSAKLELVQFIQREFIKFVDPEQRKEFQLKLIDTFNLDNGVITLNDRKGK